MWNLLLAVLFLKPCFSATSFIDFYNWGDYDPKILLKNVTIGEVQYNTFNKIGNRFCLDSCPSYDDTNVVSYPSSYDYPQIVLIEDSYTKMLNYSDNNKQSEKDALDKVLNEISANKNVKLDISLGWRKPRGEETLVQIVVAWNHNETFLIIIIREKTDVSKGFIKLGRGLERYYFGNLIPTTGINIYEISSKKVLRLNCLNTSEVPDNSTYPFSISPSYLSNMGGQRVVVKGPCSIKTNQKIEIYNKARSILKSVSLNTVDPTFHTFDFLMPTLWLPGIYYFRFEYDQRFFETEAEIYSDFDKNRKLTWINSEQMNNQYFNLKTITLTTSEVPESFKFRVFTFTNNEHPQQPNIITTDVSYSGDTSRFSIKVDEFVNTRFDYTTDIGFFSMISKNEEYWSAPFSLIWLRAYKANNDGKFPFTNSECESFLKKNNKQAQSFCPDSSEKAKYLLSTYRGDIYNFMPLDLEKSELTMKNCFVEMVKNNTEPQSRGVTCCYNSNGALIYGEDYYLRNNSLIASYGWAYSPLAQPYEHFLFDRVPIMSCCSLINSSTMCSQYWEGYNTVRLSNVHSDHAGNVFGDPHFMPFDSRLNYSFLSRGEFWLVNGSYGSFGLQGRFYSNNQSQSMLKGIAFWANSNKIMISTKRSNVTRFDWSIVVNEDVVQLPFISKGITIVQLKDMERLSIYIKTSDNNCISIELSRLFSLSPLDEYLNLKLFVSNNVRDKIRGGLLGTVYNSTTSSSLQSRDGSTPGSKDSDYFSFGKSWQLNDKKESLFSYISETEHGILNAIENFKDINYSITSEECDNITFCNIDKNIYNNPNMWQQTKAIFNDRKAYNTHLKEVNYGTNGVCDHPQWSFIKLDSYLFNNGSTINIVGCIDQDRKMEYINQTIRCQDSPLSWIQIAPINKLICHLPITPSPNKSDKVNDQYIIYICVPLVLIFIVVLVVISIIFYKRRHNNQLVGMKSEISATSQDPLKNGTTITMDDIYDTWQPAVDEGNDYAVYSEIKKP